MDLTFLSEFSVPMIVSACLCVGYVLKNFVKTDAINKYIPAIMGVLGIALNIWANKDFTPEILLAGMCSGLSSTGLHQAFTQLINKE